MKNQKLVLLLLAVFVVALLFLMRPTGNLVVRIQDAPVNLEKLEVKIAGFEVVGTDDVVVTVPFTNGQNETTVDLLALQNVSAVFAVAQLASGNYTKMRFTVTGARATFAEGVTVDLTVPPAKIDIIVQFEIKAAETTVILIDVDPDWIALSEHNEFRPVLKATILEQP